VTFLNEGNEKNSSFEIKFQLSSSFENTNWNFFDGVKTGLKALCYIVVVVVINK
jgi:hypothetical protein